MHACVHVFISIKHQIIESACYPPICQISADHVSSSCQGSSPLQERRPWIWGCCYDRIKYSEMYILDAQWMLYVANAWFGNEGYNWTINPNWIDDAWPTCPARYLLMVCSPEKIRNIFEIYLIRANSCPRNSAKAGYRRASFLWQVFIWQVLFAKCTCLYATYFIWQVFIWQVLLYWCERVNKFTLTIRWQSHQMLRLLWQVFFVDPYRRAKFVLWQVFLWQVHLFKS